MRGSNERYASGGQEVRSRRSKMSHDASERQCAMLRYRRYWSYVVTNYTFAVYDTLILRRATFITLTKMSRLLFSSAITLMLRAPCRATNS